MSTIPQAVELEVSRLSWRKRFRPHFSWREGMGRRGWWLRKRDGRWRWPGWSGVGSLKAELEEEISSSLQLARRHGEERLMVEKERWREEMAGMERERDMERRNATLRYQQLQEEKDKLKQEVERLQEKVRLIHLEKEQLDEQVAELMEKQRCRSPVTAVGSLATVAAVTREVGTMAKAMVSSKEASTMADVTMPTSEEDLKRSHREEELLQTVQALSVRVEEQDDQLAQVKEDNIVLRSQVTLCLLWNSNTNCLKC